MLNDWIDLIAFRKFMTKGQMSFMVVFYAIISIILLVGNVFLFGVKAFAWVLGLFVDNK